MTAPFMSSFPEAVVGVEVEGTLQVPDPDGANVVRFLKLDYTGPRAWPYIYFHWADGEHSFISLN